MKNNLERFLRMFFVILVMLPLAIFCLPNSPEAKRPARQESPTPISPQTEGRWDVKPLVVKDMPAPETARKFLEFGDGYWLDSGILLFWGKYGPQKTNQALYSLKDGQMKRLIVENVPFKEPDDIEKKVRITANDDVFNTHILSFGRLVYLEIPSGYDRTIYACDGERLVRVLGKDDQITIGGVPYLVGTASFANIDNGRVSINFNTKKPANIRWKAWHDGANLTLLWTDGRRLPGIENATIKSIWHVVSFPDAVLALLDMTDQGTALFRITSESTERIIGVGDSHPLNPEREIVAFSGSNIVFYPYFKASSLNDFIIRVVTNKKTAAKSNLSGRDTHFLLYKSGKWIKWEENISLLLKWSSVEFNKVGRELSELEYLFDPIVMDGKLIKNPTFRNTAGKRISLLDVIGWKSATEAVVRLSDGFYLISRQ